MKKIVSFLFIACFSATLFSQTIVSTIPSNKNVVLEEFTGKTCQYCPDGHKRAQQLMNQYPGRFFAINVHQGSYASGSPNYTTPYGNALASQAGMGAANTGYPAGTVSRQAVSGAALMGASAFLYDRGQWAPATSVLLSQSSCLNVAAEGTLDWNTRTLNLLVEVYYTGNAVQSTNKLTVAMLQNNIIGPQVGMNLYPEMIVDGLYRHMHMLRHFITGQWGVDITPTTTGNFWSHTFEYNIPNHFNNIDVILEDLEFFVYVAENEKTIISAAEANITHVNMPAIGARLDGLSEIQVLDCSADACVSVKVKNVGQNPISSVELNYTIANGTPNTLVWDNRTIASMTTDTIQIPFQIQENLNQIIKVDLIKINNEPLPLLTKSITIKKEVVIGYAVMKFVLTTDRYASETRFYIYKPDGTILLQGGPWPDLGSNGTTVREFDFVPPTNGCYRIEVTDSYGDGINAGYGAGNVKILNGQGTQIYYNNGQFGSKLTVMVTVSDMYQITATAGENGKISPTGETFYPEGTSARYTFTPNANYEVEEVFIDNEPMGLAQATEYTFTEIDRDYTIKVTFRLLPGFFVTATAGENGKISPAGETFYPEGSSAKYTFTPNANYEVEEVFIDDEPMGLAQATEYTFPVVDKGYKIHVDFRLIQGINDINGITISIAPNPINDELFVTGMYDKLEICSISGQILTTVYNQSTIDVNHLTKGIYFVKIQCNGQICTFKVVK